jgi:superfamily I DNA/RNA helicase
MRLPTWDELVPAQRGILAHPLDEPLFVVGPPGSGKTILAVRRAQDIVRAEQTVTVVTFNRMLRRLVELLDAGNRDSLSDSARARTMHKYVWHDYLGRPGAEKSHVSDYDYDWDGILAHVEQHEPGSVHLVVDEGQDLPEGFFRYAAKVARALTVFADEDQALGERRTTIKQIQAAAGLPAPTILSENHRNTPDVAAVAHHFHQGLLPTATVKRKSIGARPRLIHAPNRDELAEQVARWSEVRNDAIGVVANSNDTVALMYRKLRKRLPSRRVDFYDSKQQNEDGIDLLSPGITILNKESAKGQEFDTAFVIEIEKMVPCTTEAQRRMMYMLCARARDHLHLVHCTPLSAGAEAALPPASLLERG